MHAFNYTQSDTRFVWHSSTCRNLINKYLHPSKFSERLRKWTFRWSVCLPFVSNQRKLQLVCCCIFCLLTKPLGSEFLNWYFVDESWVNKIICRWGRKNWVTCLSGGKIHTSIVRFHKFCQMPQSRFFFWYFYDWAWNNKFNSFVVGW